MSDGLKFVEIPERHEVRVFLGKKRVGTIVKMKNVLGHAVGFQYRPKGSTHLNGGETFCTLAECKQSLR